MTLVSQSWVFSNLIAVDDPGAGYLRFSHRNTATTTAFYVDGVDVNGVDRSAGIGTLGAGDVLRVHNRDVPTRSEEFRVTGSAVDETGWFTVPVARIAVTGSPLQLLDGAVYTLTLFAPGEAGVESSYATVDELKRVLQLPSATAPQLVAMERALDAAATEINAELGLSLPLAAPYPALVVQVNLERAVEHWKQEQSPFGIVVLGGESAPAFSARNSWRRHALTLLPLKENFGVA